MKIAIDARMINHSGIGTYIRNLIPEIARDASIKEITLVGKSRDLSSFNTNKKIVILDCNIPIYSLKEQLSAKIFNNLDADIVHFPHFNIPYFLNKKNVVTIHDIIPVKHPEFCSTPLLHFYASIFVRRAITRAEEILCVSSATKKDILDNYDVAPRKVEVTHIAPAPEFRPFEGGDRRLEEIREKYNLPKEFILCVSNIYPHKNIGLLVEAYRQVKNSIAARLVLVGKPNLKSRSIGKLMRIISEDRDIMHFPYISQEELVSFYNLASFCCMPSLCEGFGLPPLEAMACKTAVIVSKIPALAEVYQDNCLYFDPHNLEELKKAIVDLSSDKNKREEFAERGFVMSGKYSWQKTARLTINAYQKAYE
ncbi:MAG: glycosyltransferase family 1 protein, partial [Candidatus Omnitrophica bacterium]|nr:glycosyltransferase family 1 protein [Candidatus Omnitrophota bacterium]